MKKAMPPKVLESMASRTPLGKMGEPADIANAYAFLASDAAAFISGAVLSVVWQFRSSKLRLIEFARPL